MNEIQFIFIVTKFILFTPVDNINFTVKYIQLIKKIRERKKAEMLIVTDGENYLLCQDAGVLRLLEFL